MTQAQKTQAKMTRAQKTQAQKTQGGARDQALSQSHGATAQTAADTI
jgi:hypothetical protein